MSDQQTVLIVTGLIAGLLLLIAIVIFVRGPVGLVKGVDWDRVSDTSGFGRFVGAILCLMALAVFGNGLAIYSLANDKAAVNIAVVVFVAVIAVLTLVLVVGQLRYQDRPPMRGSHERR